MRKQVKMEFETLEAAKDYAVDGKVIDFNITDSGYLCTVLDEVQNVIPERKETKEKFLVYCYVNGSKLYVAKKGTTFYQSEAKQFSREQASAKALFMTRNGNYEWKFIEV